MADLPHLNSLPLFPLNTVLFPGSVLSLQVFEVRYLDMVRKCQSTGTPFGVVALQSGHEVRKAGAQAEQLYTAGVLAHITELDASQPGLMLLHCEGGQRFEIERSWQLPHGLWMADVHLQAADSVIPVPAHLLNTAHMLFQVLMNMHGQDAAQLPTPAQLKDCSWVANRWASLLPLPVAVKQQLMTLDNPLLRLELIADVLEQGGAPHFTPSDNE